MDEMYSTFLGHPFSYWLTLQRMIEEKGLEYDKLITEICQLRYKVSFYESRLQEMNKVKDIKI